MRSERTSLVGNAAEFAFYSASRGDPPEDLDESYDLNSILKGALWLL